MSFRLIGVKMPLLVGLEQTLGERRLLVGRQVGIDVVDREGVPHVGFRLGRVRLRRPAFLTRHLRLRHRPFLDRPDRLAGDAVEHVEPSGLVRGDDHVAVAAVVTDGGQLRRRAPIEVPEIVVHELEVPEPLAGARVERDDRRAEEIRADAVGAVEVVGGRAQRDEGDAALGVDGHLPPVVDAADVLVGVLRPGVVAELTRTRHGVERPHQPAGEDVVRADISGRRHVPLAGRAAQNDQVLEGLARIVRLDVADRRRVAAVEADPQVDDAVCAEGHDRLAGLRVHLLQQAVHREDQPLIAAVGSLPVVEAAAGHAVHVFADPQLLAGLRVDRDQRPVAAPPIDHAPDDNRMASGIAERIRPRHLELGDVGLVDLPRLEEARVVRPAAVSGPPLVGGGLRHACRHHGDGRREAETHRGRSPRPPSTLSHAAAPTISRNHDARPVRRRDAGVRTVSTRSTWIDL